MITFAAVAKILEKDLSRNRYRHCLGVAKLAGELAKIHGWNIEDARMAGLVHDAVKEWKPRKLYNYVRRHRLPIPNLRLIYPRFPNLLHAYVGADVARRQGWIRTPAQIRAVSAHTLGRVPMGIPESILFVADLAAYGRPYPEARRIRKVARRDLRAALVASLIVKFQDQFDRQRPLHPMPVAVWNSLWK